MSAPYLLAIRGQLVITGYEPDGDSMRFIANNPGLFSKLHRGFKVRPSARDGSVQLRLEAIDAPETHYGKAAQPDGDTSRAWLLDAVGFTEVTDKPGKTLVTSSTPTSIPALIYTKAADPHGRPICYLHVGTNTGPRDGIWAHVTAAVLERTINAHALAAGVAYPLIYTSTPADHAAQLRAVAREARDAKAGVWAVDQTSLFQLIDQDSIGPAGQLILPKLFRRATDYLKEVASGGFTGNLADWLIAHTHGSRRENDTVVVPPGVEVPLSSLVEQRNSWIAFTADVLTITFVET